MDVFRQLEFALKVAFRNALIKIGYVLSAGCMGAFDDQQLSCAVISQFALSKTGQAIAIR